QAGANGILRRAGLLIRHLRRAWTAGTLCGFGPIVLTHGAQVAAVGTANAHVAALRVGGGVPLSVDLNGSSECARGVCVVVASPRPAQLDALRHLACAG